MVLGISMDRALEMTQAELICWINDLVDAHNAILGEE